MALIAVGLLYIAGTFLFQESSHTLSESGQLLFWIAYFLFFAIPRPVRLYENGVSFGPPDSRRLRFVTWEQLERYQFEGDHLILTGTDSTLKGGPVVGGVLRIRAADRARVESILAQHLPAMP
jgi:hypothetical protein